MAPHMSPACGAHVFTPRLIAQCRPLNLPLPLRLMPPEGDYFLGIHVETRTRDEDFPIAITTAAHMRAMFYSSHTRLPMTHAPMPPPAPPSMCNFKWYKLVIDEVRGGAQGNNNCALSGVRFHDALGKIIEIRSAANPKGSSPAKHAVANLMDLSVDTWWVDTTYGAAKSCEVEFTMAHFVAPASVMLFSADELLNDPVAYTLLGRATYTGAWQELATFVPHRRPNGHRDIMAPIERFSAYNPMASNCVQPVATGGKDGAALALGNSVRTLLGEEQEREDEEYEERAALASAGKLPGGVSDNMPSRPPQPSLDGEDEEHGEDEEDEEQLALGGDSMSAGALGNYWRGHYYNPFTSKQPDAYYNRRDQDENRRRNLRRKRKRYWDAVRRRRARISPPPPSPPPPPPNLGFSQVAKLVATDGAAADRFGGVSISDDTLVVGAYGANDDKGAAFIFFRRVAGSALSTWLPRATLVAADGRPGDMFGCSVAIFGDIIIVGAAGSRGAAYIYARDMAGLASSFWTQQAKLVSPDGGMNHRFGWSVSISFETVIVGASSWDDAKVRRCELKPEIPEGGNI